MKSLRIPTVAGFMAICGCGSLQAQLDLEGSVPSNWSATAGTLAISPHHYKLGTESLRWDWNGGSVITVANPGISAADVTNFFKNTCDFWVWNGAAVPGGKLRVEFMNGATAQYWFDFHLDYTGWRRAVRSYTNDMSKKPSPSATFTSVRVTAPTTGTGSLYLDAVTWVGDRFTRIRDAQNPDISGRSSSTSFAIAYAVPLDPSVPPAPTTAEINELNTIRSRWLTASKSTAAPSASSVASAAASFAALNIVEDANGIRGQPLGHNNPGLESWPLTLARDYVWGTSATAAASRDQVLRLARHLRDQGHAANSNTLPTEPAGPDGYDYRGLPNALVLMAPAYDAATKAELWEFFRWAYRLNDSWTDTWERNTDHVYLQSMQELGAILFLTPDDSEAVRHLKGYKRYMERFWQFSEGSEDGVKVDGIGFHHRSHYNIYMYAYTTMATTAYILRGTGFQIDQPAYENLRLAFMTYMRMSADGTGNTFGYFGNSLSGRKPLDTDTSFSKTALQQLGEVGGTFYGQSADPVIARAYNRRFGVGNYVLFTPYGAEDPPDGFLQYNYSPLGIYRRANWVASIRAPQRYFWSSEIYSEDNRYGRYQAYGALEILYYGGRAMSGQQLNGWDWNHTPGSTTIVLPDSKLVAENAREDVRSQLNFAGALAFQDGQSGLYAGNFQESNAGPNHNPTFVWRKSWFAFGSQIVCLGSDIANNDGVNPTATTLFQGALASPSTALTLNGTAITGFPHASTVSGANANWLLDPFGTGYLVQPGNNLNISRSTQTSAHNDGVSPPTTGDFAKAWLDHGTAPTGAHYEYAVFPATNASAMAAAASAHANPATKPYQVIQHDSTAHVVKWKESSQIGYALYASSALPAATQNAGLLISVQRPCLVMTQLGTSDDAWISVVDPDLNFSETQAAYGLPDASIARTLDFTVHGSWALNNPDTGTSIVASNATTTTIRVTTQHGLAEHVRLIATPGFASWANLGSDWNDPANWGGTPPANDLLTDIAALGAATVQPVLGSFYSVKGVTLDGGTSLSGNGNLALGAGGVVATGNDNMFSLSNLTLAISQTWDIGAGNLPVSSAIGGLASASLTKAGSGTLTLSGANTYLGGTTISAGAVTVENNQSGATGGWSIGPANTATTVVNFNSSSTVTVASGKQIRIGNVWANGTLNSALNVAGVVNNSGTLLMGRSSTLVLNSGANWSQGGTMTIQGRGGYAAALTINSGAFMTYSGSNTFKVNAATTSSGRATLAIDGTGLFTTAAGFENQTSTTTTGYGRVTLTNGGTVKLSAAVADFTTQTQFELGTGGGVIDNGGFNTTLSGTVATGYGPITTGIFGPGSLTSEGSGTLTLSGANTYTGDTIVSEGTLTLGQINASNEASTVLIASGAVLNLTFAGTDTVDKLFLNGVQQPVGVYGSGNSGGRITGSGSLTVSSGPASGYTSWIGGFGLALADQDPADDPDNDGMNNLLEFVLNGNPSISDSSILPDLVVTATDFEFTYQRRDDSVSPETTQTFQWGTTLATWPGSVVVTTGGGSFPPATVTVTAGTPSDAVTDTVKVSIPKSEAGGSGKLFGRLQVVKP